MAPMTLPPGFRFHPTDEELVTYYLKRKVHGQKMELEVIPEVYLYKCEPWNLPEKSFLPGRDHEWYFFCPRDRKYRKGLRMNRATQAGYWKPTGKDSKVCSHMRTIGTKKTLIFYRGRAPHGCRTDWVMKEYRLDQKECDDSASMQDAYALCRVFKNSGPRPKSGEQYREPMDHRSPFAMGSSYYDNMVAPPVQEESHKELSIITKEDNGQINSTIPSETFSEVMDNMSADNAAASRLLNLDTFIQQSLNKFTSHPNVENVAFPTVEWENIPNGPTLSKSRMLAEYYKKKNSSAEEAEQEHLLRHVHPYAEIISADTADYLQLDDLASCRSVENHQKKPNVAIVIKEKQGEDDAFILDNHDLQDYRLDGVYDRHGVQLFYNSYIHQYSDSQIFMQHTDYASDAFDRGTSSIADGELQDRSGNFCGFAENNFLRASRSNPYNFSDGGDGKLACKRSLDGFLSDPIHFSKLADGTHCFAEIPATLKTRPEEIDIIKFIDSDFGEMKKNNHVLINHLKLTKQT